MRERPDANIATDHIPNVLALVLVASGAVLIGLDALRLKFAFAVDAGDLA